MNKSAYIKILLCCLVIAICVRVAYTQQEASEATRPDVGRQDPFSQVARDKPKSLIKKVFQSGQAEELPELFVETVMLKFLNAKNLQTALANMTTADGTIAVDSKSNSLIISDTAENLAKITAEIRKADKTPQQIMVEVVILDVQLNDDTEIGINWDILFDDRNTITYKQTVSSTLATSGVIGGDFGIITGNITNVVHALQEKKDVEILASPRVMMVSGQSAYIEAIEEIPYTEITDTSEGGAGALTSTVFKEVGIKMTVSASLTDDNDIVLTVDAEQNVQTGTSDKGVPIVDTRKAKTSLLLRDSQIVIMGGLRRQEKTTEVDQIPLLGDLPIIGELFKNTKNIVKNSELVVFISPHIHKGELPSEDEMAKFNEITNRPLLKLPEQDDTGEGN